MNYVIQPGHPYPLGATWDGSGVNFALFSERAERVQLCLFDKPYGAAETTRVPLAERTDGVWHVYLPEARPGQLYGYRVYGPYEPERGLRFNPHKLLLDPYAKAIAGPVTPSQAMFGFPLDGAADRDLGFSDADSALEMSKCIVTDPSFSWGGDRPPRTPWRDTVIYEAHVRGLTRLNPHIPERLRGTYAGIAHHHTVRYLRELGVTAIELLPVHHITHHKGLLDRRLANYWGYDSIGFFAPDSRYSSADATGGQVAEFKTMVKTLHNAGIEVLLDVVYNHTGEGNQYGPALSFRGIDNVAYYRLKPGQPRFYADYTGTGNTLDTTHPRVLQLVMDSLRYWVSEMHVDGFRFDLAPALARNPHAFDRLSPFFGIIQQDPVISQVKLIAEPWDVGEGGYQVGNFPQPWREWNDKYRDCIRRYWRGDGGQVGQLATRLTGSSDLYARDGRGPLASINYVTCHDGFTLHDLVSYNTKHNEPNGEGNRDGANHNLSSNYGVEGETDDREIHALRARQMRNLMTTVLLSQGAPMILHGDEVARTQRGNNNAYAQDNETAWQPWQLTDEQKEMLAWTRRIIAFRWAHPILRRRDFFEYRKRPRESEDILWLRPDGKEMTDPDWHNEETRALSIWLNGCPHGLRDDRGEPVTDDTLLILLNSSEAGVEFRLPGVPRGKRWNLALDTDRPQLAEGGEHCPGRSKLRVTARSIVVLSHPTPAAGRAPFIVR